MITINNTQDIKRFILYKTHVDTISRIELQNSFSERVLVLDIDTTETPNYYIVEITDDESLSKFEGSNMLFVYNNLNELKYKEVLQYDIR
jgi:hypothetical protein